MSEVKRYGIDYENQGMTEYDDGEYVTYTDYQAAQAKFKELEGSVATIPYDEMKESMLRLYKQQVPRLNDVIDEQKARIEKLEQANKILREGLRNIYTESYSWVITESTGRIEKPIHDSYRNLTTSIINQADKIMEE